MSRKSSRPGVVHRCHLSGCRTETNPRMLFCLLHWRMLPKDLQVNVLNTVHLRDMNHVDATWAPWWRAQAAAHVWLLRKLHCDPRLPQELIDKALEVIFKIEKKDADFVAYLERKGQA